MLQLGKPHLREKELPPWSLYADRAETSPNKPMHTSATTAQVFNAKEEYGKTLEEGEWEASLRLAYQNAKQRKELEAES